MGFVKQAPAAERETPTPQSPLIDCDIHIAFPDQETLFAYLPQHWQEHQRAFGMRGHHGSHYPRAMPNAARHDSWPPSGGPPGSDLEFLQDQLLDRWGIQYGILNPLLGVGEQRNLDWGAALARAINDWQADAWIDREPRLRGSIVMPYEDGNLAAAEIERLASDSRFVQALLIARTGEPLGRRKYWPMYAAAARHDLPIGVHFGGAGGAPITGGGWPSHYIEDHCGMAQAFQAQIISLIYEGVFDAFPTLQFVLIEGGFAWLPPLMWRMDRAWEKLAAEVPRVTQLPSTTIRRHFWITTQPIEEPPDDHTFLQLLGHLDMDDRLLFATDYPHWDFDAPNRALPNRLDRSLRRAILGENAQNLYRFR